MKIETLRVRNFRALTDLHLENIGDSVVLAGPNGCGKSCALDAIRLLKSAYGGYGPNEWQSWFGEFKIDLNKSTDHLLTLFQDRRKPLSISMQVRLSTRELDYLRQNAEKLIREKAWQEVAPARTPRSLGTSLATEQRTRRPQVELTVNAALPAFLKALEAPTHLAQITIQPGEGVEAGASVVLEMVFSLYIPTHIGIIDFHGANRNYNREQLGGINLNIESNDARLKQHALYNSANKYQNLKSEMAASYVRHLLAKNAQPNLKYDDSLTAVLKELFSTFFPGKEFLGPRPTPDGFLEFPVRTATGAEHDIDELSSGEKEVLYGYLRLRNSAPENSVIMIDEPELHLNPRLVHGLASFYQRHLGQALNNQLWLVTHSDTLIREAVGQRGFSVFHLQPADAVERPNQAVLVSASDELDRCVIDLVGDMAAYRPGAKLVLFEGGGDTEFDVRMTSVLFPEFAKRINPISGGSKRRVTDLYELLESARRQGHIPARFYLVTDSDGEAQSSNLPMRHQWGAYHIENYLLEPCFIQRVLDEVAVSRRIFRHETEIDKGLRESARETIPDLVAHDLRRICNGELLRCIDLEFDPTRRDVDAAIHEAITRSEHKIGKIASTRLTATFLQHRSHEVVAQATESLQSDDWRQTFRGRQVLRRFVGKTGTRINYETFRDLTLARMAEAEYQPVGMARVVTAILKD